METDIKYKVVDAPDDFGYFVRDAVTNQMLGRCFVNPGGLFVSDFYGPGSPGIPYDFGKRNVKYWFIRRRGNGLITQTPCTENEFFARFDLPEMYRP